MAERQAVPSHIVVASDGRWLTREHVVATLAWAASRMTGANAWERKFLGERIDGLTKLLGAS